VATSLQALFSGAFDLLLMPSSSSVAADRGHAFIAGGSHS
jgi:hypothetical protein